MYLLAQTHTLIRVYLRPRHISLFLCRRGAAGNKSSVSLRVPLAPHLRLEAVTYDDPWLSLFSHDLEALTAPMREQAGAIIRVFSFPFSLVSPLSSFPPPPPPHLIRVRRPAHEDNLAQAGDLGMSAAAIYQQSLMEQLARKIHEIRTFLRRTRRGDPSQVCLLNRRRGCDNK